MVFTFDDSVPNIVPDVYPKKKLLPIPLFTTPQSVGVTFKTNALQKSY